VNDFHEGWDEWLAFFSLHLPEAVRLEDAPDQTPLPRTSGNETSFLVLNSQFSILNSRIPYRPGRISCEKVTVLTSRNIGVSGGSFVGSRKSVSNAKLRVGAW